MQSLERYLVKNGPCYVSMGCLVEISLLGHIVIARVERDATCVKQHERASNIHKTSRCLLYIVEVRATRPLIMRQGARERSQRCVILFVKEVVRYRYWQVNSRVAVHRDCACCSLLGRWGAATRVYCVEKDADRDPLLPSVLRPKVVVGNRITGRSRRYLVSARRVCPDPGFTSYNHASLHFTSHHFSRLRECRKPPQISAMLSLQYQIKFSSMCSARGVENTC